MTSIKLNTIQFFNTTFKYLCPGSITGSRVSVVMTTDAALHAFYFKRVHKHFNDMLFPFSTLDCVCSLSQCKLIGTTSRYQIPNELTVTTRRKLVMLSFSP